MEYFIFNSDYEYIWFESLEDALERLKTLKNASIWREIRDKRFLIYSVDYDGIIKIQ